MEKVVTESCYKIPGLGSLYSKSHNDNRIIEKVPTVAASFLEFTPTIVVSKQYS